MSIELLELLLMEIKQKTEGRIQCPICHSFLTSIGYLHYSHCQIIKARETLEELKNQSHLQIGVEA